MGVIRNERTGDEGKVGLMNEKRGVKGGRRIRNERKGGERKEED